jgi:membrane-associated phospholipid phosphatase
MTKYKLSYQNFVVASVISIVSAIISFSINVVLGSIPFFSLVNHDFGAIGDNAFSFITHLGEEVPWIILGIITLIFRRQYFPLAFFACLISTLLAQGIKNVLPEQARPSKAIGDASLYHSVKGIVLHSVNSFPSGHTTAAFTLFLLCCLFIHKKWIIPVGFAYALAVGYSRVYLAQHFPKDVAGGMLVAVISVCFAIAIQQIIVNKFYTKR